MNCQTFSSGFNSGERGGSGSKVMLAGTGRLAERVPAGLIEHQDGVAARIDGPADLLQVLGHGLGCRTRA